MLICIVLTKCSNDLLSYMWHHVSPFPCPFGGVDGEQVGWEAGEVVGGERGRGTMIGICNMNICICNMNKIFFKKLN